MRYIGEIVDFAIDRELGNQGDYIQCISICKIEAFRIDIRIR